MSRPDLLIVSPLLPDQMAELAAAFTLHRLDQAADKPALLAQVAPRIRGVVTTGGPAVTGALIAALPALELVATASVGTDHLDLAALAARGIPYANTPDVLNDDVADLGIGLILAALRAIPQGDAHVRSGAWARDGRMGLTTSATGKVLGIVGLGRIGQELASRAAALKMRIAYHGRKPQAVSYDYYADLVDLARASDVLVLTCPGGAATQDLIGTAVLEALGARGWLINLSRGSVVQEPALIAALQEDVIRGAALDVYATEPVVNPVLRAMPQVLHSPHHASGTLETRNAMSDRVVTALRTQLLG
jgi:lactate dehydrogenase-like 2-hydroxyacid dehydrogenase